MTPATWMFTSLHVLNLLCVSLHNPYRHSQAKKADEELSHVAKSQECFRGGYHDDLRGQKAGNENTNGQLQLSLSIEDSLLP
ncbi:hypothetical protein B0T13DRAFT_118319 [Neurospora crassa]|nr:hypothetical protein B0T13DRAFT_118319 [Neurospora crassa]